MYNLIQVSVLRPNRIDDTTGDHAQTIRRAYQPGLSSVPGPLLARYTNLVLKWHVIQGRRTKYIHALHEEHGRRTPILTKGL